jgi:hypothetical protein
VNEERTRWLHPEEEDVAWQQSQSNPLILYYLSILDELEGIIARTCDPLAQRLVT